MSSVAVMREVSTTRCLTDMPFEILYEVLCRLPKRKLVDISRLCSRLKDVAGDTRLWKNVYIKYRTINETLDFEDLYSEPWPVKVIDLTKRKINPPVLSEINQVVKVNTLYLAPVYTDEKTVEAILTKYQCTELYLYESNDPDLCHTSIKGIAAGAFSTQKALEVLSLIGVWHTAIDEETKKILIPRSSEYHEWLGPVLSNLKNLKALDLSYNHLTNFDMMGFVEKLPVSLESLRLVNVNPEDCFFELLAKSAPNLRELELSPKRVKMCPSLLRFQFLKTLRLNTMWYSDIPDLYLYLIKFPALKTVYIIDRLFEDLQTKLQKLGTTAKPHSISVERLESRKWSFPKDAILWDVTKRG